MTALADVLRWFRGRNGHVRSACAILRRPSLWTACLRFIPHRWWSFRPYLPVPPREYRQFRMDTMYGDPNHAPSPEDLVTFLRWARDTHRRAKREEAS